MTERTYLPINCGLYDQLEAFAVKRIMVSITFESQANLHDFKDATFLDFKTQKDGEFAKLFANGEMYMVRLDYLKTINGIAVKDAFGGSCSLPKLQ
jgi:transcriptional antiterminator Rof (Rho-off)